MAYPGNDTIARHNHENYHVDTDNPLLIKIDKAHHQALEMAEEAANKAYVEYFCDHIEPLIIQFLEQYKDLITDVTLETVMGVILITCKVKPFPFECDDEPGVTYYHEFCINRKGYTQLAETDIPGSDNEEQDARYKHLRQFLVFLETVLDSKVDIDYSIYEKRVYIVKGKSSI